MNDISEVARQWKERREDIFHYSARYGVIMAAVSTAFLIITRTSWAPVMSPQFPKDDLILPVLIGAAIGGLSYLVASFVLSYQRANPIDGLGHIEKKAVRKKAMSMGNY